MAPVAQVRAEKMICDVSSPNYRQAAVTIQLTDVDKVSDTAGGFTATLSDSDQFGIAVDAIGDLNSDGVQDLAVGAWMHNVEASSLGAVYILFMNEDRTVASSQLITEGSGGFAGNLDDGDRFGYDVSGIGDLDGDGVEDIAVGARADDDGGANRGAIYILLLNADGTVKGEQKISSLSGGLTGPLADADLFGFEIEAVGDLDGDGVTDLAVGAFQDDDGGTDRGAMYLLYMNTNGTVKSEVKISSSSDNFTTALQNGGKFGHGIASLGDLDGDGVNDIAVGAPVANGDGTSEGAVYILFMNADETIKSYKEISENTNGFGALDDFDRFGASLSGMGDIDGDGSPDLLVGAWTDDDGGTDRGAVYLLRLNANGTVNSYEKFSATHSLLSGRLDTDSDFFGFNVNAADIDSDGRREVFVGALGDDDGGTNRGAFYIMDIDRFSTSEPGRCPSSMNLSFIVENNAMCSPDREITVRVSGEEVADVLIGDDKFFVGDDWRPYTGPNMEIPWTLTEGDGEKALYAMFRSSCRNLSNVYRATIELDTQNACGLGTEPSEEEDADLPEEEELGEEKGIRLGEVVKLSGDPALYYLDDARYLHAFLNEATYFTWFENFDVVKEVEPEVFASFRQGGYMPPKPGSVLMKVPDSPRVYFLEEDKGSESFRAKRRWISSEAVAKELYGSDWAQYVLDVSVLEFVNFTRGSDVEDANDVEFFCEDRFTRADLAERIQSGR